VSDAELASNYSGIGACGASTWASTLNDNAAPTCTQPAFTDISGSVTDAQVPNTITVDLATAATALAANPTDCAANQFANAIVANGNLTCAQPNFTDLAGTATDAQIPNTITISLAATATALAADPTDCTANQYANAIAASGNLTCAQPDHANLQNLAIGDPHTQYLLLAGRSGGQSANGGTAAGDDLTLNSTANATKGSIFFGSEWEWLDLVPDPADGTSGNGGLWNPTVSVTGNAGTTSNLRGIYLNPTVNYNDVSPHVVIDSYKAVEGAGTFTVSGTATQASAWALFAATSTLDSTLATAVPPTPVAFRSALLIKYSATSGTGAMNGTAAAFQDSNTYRNIDAGGTFTLAAPTSFVSSPIFTETAGALNITTFRGFWAANPTINGTPQVTTQVGVDIDKPTRAGTGAGNIGLRNSGTTVYTNTNQAVNAATDTITCAATYQTITLPSGNITLTSNPSIADGATGQICILQNVGANTLTLTDATNGMNLAAATRALASDDTLMLIYGGAAGDWVEIAFANN